jgi:hypothetical protein
LVLIFLRRRAGRPGRTPVARMEGIDERAYYLAAR